MRITLDMLLGMGLAVAIALVLTLLARLYP